MKNHLITTVFVKQHLALPGSAKEAELAGKGFVIDGATPFNLINMTKNPAETLLNFTL